MGGFDGGAPHVRTISITHSRVSAEVTTSAPSLRRIPGRDDKSDLDTSNDKDAKRVSFLLPGHESKPDPDSSDSTDSKDMLPSSAPAYRVPQRRVESSASEAVEERDRECESSSLVRFAPTSFVLVAEAFPVWALCLERLFCASIYIPDYDNSATFLAYLEDRDLPAHLWTRLVSHLGSGRVHFGRDGPEDAIHLCSGSLRFLRRYCDTHPTVRALLAVDKFMRVKTLPEDVGVSWHRARHVEFGGATRLVTLIGYKGLVATPATTQLRRTIGDFVEYGLESTAFRSQPDALEVGDLLHPLQLDRVVRYPSGRSFNGSITRALVPEELGLVYGLPTWLRAGGLAQPSSFAILPLQILDGFLKSVLRQAPTERQGRFDARAPVRAPDRPRPAEVWFESIQAALPGSWIDATLVTDKAAKSDKAGVPKHLWDQRILLIWPHLNGRLEWLRDRLMHLAMRSLYLEFREFMATAHGADWSSRLRIAQEAARHNGGLKGQNARLQGSGRAGEDRELIADAQAGRSALLCFGASDWWEWKGGSTLNFWRWPEGEQRRAARDGMRAYIIGQLPRNRKPSRPPRPDQKRSIFGKIVKVLRRGYLAFSPKIKSLVDAFPVPKGDDIRMVYNGASCGLNEALWAPNFWLPKAASASRLLDYGYFSVDLDMGEMFPNFPLPQALRPYSGLDLSPFRSLFETDAPDLLRDAPGLEDGQLWVRWERNWMGTLPSPYMSIRFFYWAEEFVRGNRMDPANALGWDKVKLNCPGSPDFDPTSARVMKWRSDVERVANDIITFVDDVRASGWSAEEAWQVSRQLAARLQYLGIQDAPRKRRPPCCDPGAWAGAIFSTLGDKITQTVSQAKWEKGRAYIREIKDFMDAHLVDCVFSYKYLEQIRGFLVHLAMTFDFLKPYLKGLHQTLAYHLGKRDKLGWKRGERDWINYVSHQVESGGMTQDEAFQALHPPAFEDIPVPVNVSPLQRMREDFDVMDDFFSAESPPVMLLRCRKVLYILYGFADASGSGFGSSFQLPTGLSLRIGTWGKDDEGKSSNWREFENVVEALEDQAAKGELADAVVYLATDNSTVEACAANGTSSSPLLHSLVVRLRLIEVLTGCRIILFHVSGERMKAQGTDGFSRGSLKEGIATGLSMLSFIPLHLSAVERSPEIEDWVRAWFPGKEVELLKPEDWFERGHDLSGGSYDSRGFWRPAEKSGIFIWAPPPGAAEAAVEELRKARIKRQNSTHVFMVPRLLGPEWKKQVHKACDFVIEIPPGHPCWPCVMYEPLIVGICLPFIRSDPWQLKGTPKVFALVRKLRRVFKDAEMDGGDILRKFLLEFERIRTMPADVVRQVLHFESGCEVSR